MWMYLAIFLAIPLVRILPRILRMVRGERPDGGGYSGEAKGWNVQTAQRPDERPGRQGNDMLILGQMIAGAKTFEAIQRHTHLSDKRLDAELQNLESRGMIRVEQRQGLTGPKVEIYPTSKGLREFHN